MRAVWLFLATVLATAEAGAAFLTGNGGLGHCTRRRVGAQTSTMMATPLVFYGAKKVLTEPFDPPASGVAGWFSDEDSLRTLFGKAETMKELSDGNYEVVVPMSSFPGVQLKSKNVMSVKRDPEAFKITLVSSTTEATGPRFLTRIVEAASNGGGAQTESLNEVSIVDGPNGRKRVQSDVSLKVSMTLPSWVPIPLATLEKQGSQSLQKLIDADVEPLVCEFRDKLVKWAASQQP